jgi:hypothetical protein
MTISTEAERDVVDGARPATAAAQLPLCQQSIDSLGRE